MDSMTSHILPHLSDETKGAWIPFHVFPNSPPFYFDITSHYISRYMNADVPLHFKLGLVAAKVPFMSGFGETTRDFVVVLGQNYYRFYGTSHDDVANDVILTTNSDPVIETLQSDDETLTIVSEEFPKLTDYCRDVLELGKKFK
jgi:hypothetical protein